MTSPLSESQCARRAQKARGGVSQWAVLLWALSRNAVHLALFAVVTAVHAQQHAEPRQQHADQIEILQAKSPEVATHAESAPLRICVQNIDYFPYYDFHRAEPRGFAADVFMLFSQRYQLTLQYEVLPVGRVDSWQRCQWRFPDNPRWHAITKRRSMNFSQAFTHNIGATIVRVEDSDKPLAQIRTIAVPRGFVPEHLIKVQSRYSFRLVDVPNAHAAIEMLLKKRVDAADVEWHVAKSIADTLGQPNAVAIGKKLPVAHIGFHISADLPDVHLQRFNQFILQEHAALDALRAHYQLTPLSEDEQD